MAIKKVTAKYLPIPPFEKVPRFLTREVCDRIKDAGAYPFTKIENSVYSETSLEIKMISPLQLPAPIRSLIETEIKRFYKKYHLQKPVYIQDFQISRYKKGSSRSMHIDGLLGDFEDSGKPMNFTNGVLTFVLQLNDGYKGGRLEFNEYHNIGNEEQNIGDLFVFPSFVWHEVKPVTRGERLSLTIFTGTEIPLMYARKK